MMKATSFVKSRKFLGIPGFWSRMKERGALVKDVSPLSPLFPLSFTSTGNELMTCSVAVGLGFGNGCSRDSG